MTKTSLVNDLAALIIKHKPAEWSALFESIKSVNFGAIEAEVLKLSAAPKPKRARAKKVARVQARSTPTDFQLLPELWNNSRRVVIENVANDLSARKLLRTSAQLKDFYLGLGGLQPLPTNRSKASALVATHLSTLPDDDFDRALSILNHHSGQITRSLRDDYAKWTDIISRGRDDRDKR